MQPLQVPKLGDFSQQDKRRFKFDESLAMVKAGKISVVALRKNRLAVKSKIDNYHPFYGPLKDLRIMESMLIYLINVLENKGP